MLLFAAASSTATTASSTAEAASSTEPTSAAASSTEPTCEASTVPRARVPGLRYVAFGDDDTADAGHGRVARLGRNMLTLDEISTLAAAVAGFEANT